MLETGTTQEADPWPEFAVRSRACLEWPPRFLPAGFRVKWATYSLVLALALGGSGAAAQQSIVKSIMPDGKVIYSEKPVPGAAKVETIEGPPPKTGVTGLTPEEKARAEQQSRQRAQAAKAAASGQKNVEEARKRLQEAEAAREKGKEPLPNERLGMAGGGSRLTEAYFARQKSLEEAVEAARKAADGR